MGEKLAGLPDIIASGRLIYLDSKEALPVLTLLFYY